MVSVANTDDFHTPEKMVANLEAEVDAILLENDKLVRRMSSFVTVYQQINDIADEYVQNWSGKKTPQVKNGVKVLGAFSSSDQIPMIDLSVPLVKYYLQPGTFF